jgi:hypothetical protein
LSKQGKLDYLSLGWRNIEKSANGNNLLWFSGKVRLIRRKFTLNSFYYNRRQTVKDNYINVLEDLEWYQIVSTFNSKGSKKKPA